MNPSGFHATNVLLHLVNGVLVFLLLRQLTGNTFVAWVAAALFLVHPVQIETVAWISSRKGLLSALFMLAALIVRLKPEVTGRNDAWFVVWLAAALMSKALAVVLPAIVLLYDLWVRRQKFADTLPRLIIPGVMCLLLLMKTMASQHSVLGGVRGHLDYSLWHILAIDTTIMWRYIGMLCWPGQLSVLYDPPTTGITAMVVAASVAWVAVAAVIWRFRARYPLVLWGAATYLLLLFPVLNFFKITTLMNDRYLYLPSIIFFAGVAAAPHRSLRFAEKLNIVLLRQMIGGLKWAIGAVAISAAFALTTLHLPVWQNPQTLWHHAMTTVPQLPVVRIQMAYTLHDAGNGRQAILTMQRGLLETEPDALDRKRMVKAIFDWDAELKSRSARRMLSRQ